MSRNGVIYCTFFDRKYLLKGLALHTSLTRYNTSAELWIVALDKYTLGVLKKLNLKGVKVVPLDEFEDPELLAVKKTRNKVEYIWTCTPSLPLYIFRELPKTKYVCYLDADLYFYSSPEDAISEIGNKSVLVVPHRFSKRSEKEARIFGHFNVGFNIFKNDKTGRKCLRRWRKQCLNDCSYKPQAGKIGDQFYLNEWPGLYNNCLVISQNKGIDLALWKVSQFRVFFKRKRYFYR